MRFKRLEMQGFKSFVDRTVIELGDGITAIVGPNGCGKSNVCDAVRWVLGEQAPKALRAKRMEDLVFNGSAERKPLGMAEVTLTLTDLKGTVTSPLYKDYEEVAVTRRLYRSGESEYLINRNPCRLKDIVDLFLDTGVSLDTFSIVEQGRIEGLVNARPQDRRLLIEEAAGIMKYKSRRNEALRKLELAQANLLRVADVLREKEGRLRSLRRQARKAAFFKEYQSEIKALDLRIEALDLLRLEDELRPAEAEYERLKEREEGHLAALASREAERETVRAQVAERSESLAETRRRAVEVEGYIQRLENSLEMLQGRLVELDAEDARRAEEAEALAREAARLGEERGRLAERETAFAGEAAAAQRAFDLRSAELSAVRAELADLEAALAEARRVQERESEAFGDARQRTALAESRLEAIAQSTERLGREAEEAGRALDEARADLEAAARRLEEIAGESARLREESDRAAREQARVEAGLRAEEAALAAAREAVVEARSSQRAIEELRAASPERAGAGAFRACGAQALAALADVLSVDPAHEKAIEAALGERLLGVVVPDAESAAAAIRALARAGAGRGIALPLGARQAHAGPLPAVEGVLGSAASLIRCAQEYRPLVESLLFGVAVARDLDAALAAWRSSPFGTTWVTLGGEVLLPSGAVEGGAPVPAAAGVLEQSRRLEALRLQAGEGEARVAALEGACARLREELARAEEEAVRLARMAREADLARVGAEGVKRSCQEKWEAVRERHEALLRERERMREERERLDRERAEAGEEGARAEHSSREAEARSQAAEEELRRVGARAAELEAEAADRRVALTEALGKASGARAELQRLEDSLGQNAARQARREEEKQDSLRKRERVEAGMAQSREELARRVEERASAEAEQRERVRALEETQARDEELGNLLRQMRAEAADLQARISEAAERRTTLRVQRESLIASARETHQVDLPEAAERERGELPLYQEHFNRLEMLRQRLERMGEVNPLAAREFDDINHEYSFLKEQQEDLERSIADLHATIERLNRTTRTRFLEALEQVQKAFVDIFGRLFQGGEARMFLLDPSDPLESGVDIEVRPPGKRPANIMLLSAGEKALTALALLFSVFSVRPSPFCLLDEVDATLDDQNVGRFRDVIAELEAKSQFIVITHNKRTMSFASQLYGVTQREKGVSEVVSVRLNRKEDGTNGAPASAAGEELPARGA
ncbi:MAG: chromosome segregation protein SMC [Candidatus Tectomicrobia bacterium]|uniref:Chromosome partition protein Smc n=1 Tax=Tectimicrobiota bacterium TaxID=2528274 RepID=A0A932HZQ0_UNCTE|nr:chromosome segregation protein SMC [Candidatus Tectomicrobia bacterium]